MRGGDFDDDDLFGEDKNDEPAAISITPPFLAHPVPPFYLTPITTLSPL